MIIITGPGRSGTSVLAQFCLKMGYDPGGSWYDCVDAGLEHPRITVINESLAREAARTGTIQQTLAKYGEEMRGFDLAVVKDPRFTFHPAILQAWHSVRNDLKVLLTYRDPEHCIASRKRHARDLILKNKTHPNMLRCDFANAIEAMLDLEIPFAMLLFPNFLKQYESVYEAFQTLGMDFDHEQGRSVWTTLVDMEKVHVRYSATVSEGAVAAMQPHSGFRWKRIPRLPLFTPGFNTVVVLPLLVGLICTPIGSKTTISSPVPHIRKHKIVSPRRFALNPLSSATHPFRRSVGRDPLHPAWLKDLSLYSIGRFPFVPLSPGHLSHHVKTMQPGTQL